MTNSRTARLWRPTPSLHARFRPMPLDLTRTLSDLVSLPSVNPMGQPAEGPEYCEYQVTEYLERLFQKLGLRYERHTIEPKRDNIVARIDGRVPAEEGGPLVLFEAHQDTVPVTGMTIEPFFSVSEISTW